MQDSPPLPQQLEDFATEAIVMIVVGCVCEVGSLCAEQRESGEQAKSPKWMMKLICRAAVKTLKW